MTISAHIGKALAGAALAAALLATAPLAQATDDGTLLTRAAAQAAAPGACAQQITTEFAVIHGIRGCSFVRPRTSPAADRSLYPRLASGKPAFGFLPPMSWPTVRPASINPAATTDGQLLSKAAARYAHGIPAADRAAYEELAKLDPTRIAAGMVAEQGPSASAAGVGALGAAALLVLRRRRVVPQLEH